MSDTDSGGVIYHGRYFNLYNLARDNQMRDMGLSYRQLTEMGTSLSIVDARCRFVRPVFYDQTILIRTGFTWYRNRSFGVLQRLFSTGADGAVLERCNEARFIVVCVQTAGRSMAIPEPLCRAMENWNLG